MKDLAIFLTQISNDIALSVFSLLIIQVVSSCPQSSLTIAFEISLFWIL